MPLMTEKQTLELTTTEMLLERVETLRAQGYRLAQIGAANMPGHLEVNYSFALQEQLVTLRLQLAGEEPRVPSISRIYWCAVLYENEMHDLFRLKVDGMAVDFQGKFYQMAVLYPFGSRKAPVAKPASEPRPAKPTAPVEAEAELAVTT
jgi:ech hydrogenase subunit D